jgi:hypothetical protein
MLLQPGSSALEKLFAKPERLTRSIPARAEWMRKMERYEQLRGREKDKIEGPRTCSVRMDAKLNKMVTSIIETTSLPQTDVIKLLLAAGVMKLDMTTMDLKESEQLPRDLMLIREQQLLWADEHPDDEPLNEEQVPKLTTEGGVILTTEDGTPVEVTAEKFRKMEITIDLLKQAIEIPPEGPRPAPAGSTNFLTQRWDRAEYLQMKLTSDPESLTEEEQTFLKEFFKEQLNKVEKPKD